MGLKHEKRNKLILAALSIAMILTIVPTIGFSDGPTEMYIDKGSIVLTATAYEKERPCF